MADRAVERKLNKLCQESPGAPAHELLIAAYDEAVRDCYPVAGAPHLVAQRALLGLVGCHRKGGKKHHYYSKKNKDVSSPSSSVRRVAADAQADQEPMRVVVTLGPQAVLEADTAALSKAVMRDGAAQVKVPLPAGGANAAASGRWQLMIVRGASPVVTQAGLYDFVQANDALTSAEGGKAPGYITCRMPIFPKEQLVSTKSLMGVTELAVTGRLVGGERVELTDVRVLAHASRNAKWFTDDGAIGGGNTMETIGRSPDGMLAPAAAFVRPSEERAVRLDAARSHADFVQAQSAAAGGASGSGAGGASFSSPSLSSSSSSSSSFFPASFDHALVMPRETLGARALGAGVVDQFVSNAPELHTTALVVVGPGGAVLHQDGTAGAPQQAVLLGELSAPLSALAVRSYHAKNSADVDLSAPGSASLLLRRSGATQLADALDKCYAASGASPSLDQLLDHSSGMPAELPLAADQVDRVRQVLGAGRLEPIDAEHDDTLTPEHDRLATSLRTSVRPLAAPGAMVNPSALNMALARSTMAGWHDDGPERYAESVLHRLGAESAQYTDSEVHGVYSLAGGLSMTPVDLARVFSDANPWYHALPGSAQREQPAADLAHLGRALEPAHCPDPSSKMATDALGLQHVNIEYLKLPMRAAMGQGCAAPVGIKNSGVAPSNVYLAVVPRLHLAAVFSTTASHGSVVNSYSQSSPDAPMTGLAQRLCAYAIAAAGNATPSGELVSSSPSSYAPSSSSSSSSSFSSSSSSPSYSSLINDQAAAHMMDMLPAVSPVAAEHQLQQRASGQVKHVFGEQDVARAGVGRLIDQQMRSALDRLIVNEAVGQSAEGATTGAWIRLVRRSPAQVYGADAPQQGTVLVLQHSPVGDTTGQAGNIRLLGQPLAWDAAAGELRTVDKASGLLGERVQLVNLGDKAAPLTAVMYRGRLYTDDAGAQRLIDAPHRADLEQRQRAIREMEAKPRNEFASATAPSALSIYSDVLSEQGGAGGGAGAEQASIGAPYRRGHGHGHGHHRGHRRRYHAGLGLGLLGGAALGTLLWPGAYRPPAWSYAPVSPYYWRPWYGGY